MSWIDVDGVEHVSGSDVTSDWGDKHILGCERCKQMFPLVFGLLSRDAR